MCDGLLLAIDQGTTNTKAIFADRDGQPIFVTSSPVSLSQPKPDFVEQDPLALWQSVTRTIADCERTPARAKLLP